MFTDKVSVHYRSFQPTQQEGEAVGALLQELLTEGPSFLKLKAQFSKEGEFAHVVYKGIIEIHSNAGTFFSKAESTQMNDLTHKLLKRSRRLFSKWKAKRIGDRARIKDRVLVEEAI